MFSSEFDYLPKPDPKFSKLRRRAYFEIFRPVLNSKEKLDLARARQLLGDYNKLNSQNSAEVRLTDVFYVSLMAKGTKREIIENEHILALGFLALDDLRSTIDAADAANASVMEKEIVIIETVVTVLMPKVPRDSSAHN